MINVFMIFRRKNYEIRPGVPVRFFQIYGSGEYSSTSQSLKNVAEVTFYFIVTENDNRRI